jgi:hypothetical protein
MPAHSSAHQSYAQKILLLRARFKCTKDLWLYITDRRKYCR